MKNEKKCKHPVVAGMVLVLIAVLLIMWFVKKDSGMDKQEVKGEVRDIKNSSDVVMEKEDPIETLELVSVEERGGEALATRTHGVNIFTHTVTATVDDPQEGKFYEGWLVLKPSDPIQFYSTGKMTKNTDGLYELVYTSDILDDRVYYNEVIITEETLADGLDNKPETHIFEAQFEG